ncbi:hypothetical protein J4411_03200 [Candidatus Pacearchaeota archaeon]|nr:hypothetical protein [Candidatus Pacearchaeota archaeon]
MKKIINLNEIKSLEGIAIGNLTTFTKTFGPSIGIRNGIVKQKIKSKLIVLECFENADKNPTTALRRYNFGNHGIYSITTFDWNDEYNKICLNELKSAGVKLAKTKYKK